MIRHATERDCWAVELLGNAAQVGKGGPAHLKIFQEGKSFFS